MLVDSHCHLNFPELQSNMEQIRASMHDNQVGHALTEVFDKYKTYQEKAKRLAFKNKQEFSFDKMTEKLDELLKQYVPEFPKQVEIKLPKLKKIE